MDLPHFVLYNPYIIVSFGVVCYLLTNFYHKKIKSINNNNNNNNNFVTLVNAVMKLWVP